MRFAPILFAASVCAACMPSSPPPAPVTAAAADELAVLALVVDSVLADADERFVVIADSTSNSHMDAEQLANFFPATDPASRGEMVRDFLAKNGAGGAVPSAIPAGAVIRMFPLREIFGGSDDFSARWAEFHRRYAPARGYHTLSRPGFDAPRRRAVVATGTVCGGRCGHGEVVLLERVGTGWRIAGRRRTWIS
ncbi:MAG TPA: hypothetical protein VEX86_24165 [Longimicrobium sp.]|nr:hypothetical protein [Longimicrobium sp.]